MGKLRVILPPARFGGARLEPGASSPGHGEHTADVLGELGVPADEIARLRERGVVA